MSTQPTPVEPEETPAERKAREDAVAEAEADIAAGRVLEHQRMRDWLLSWGTAKELPPPNCE